MGSILNSLNKVLVLSTVVLSLSVNAVPFSPPDHKPYVVEAIHITDTAKSLLELGSSAAKLGKSILQLETVAPRIASTIIKPTTPKLGIGGTALKVFTPIAIAITAFGTTNEALDLKGQAANKNRMKAEVDKAISNLSYVLKTGGRPVQHNGKTYEIEEILETYKKAALEFYVPDTGWARDTAIVLRNAFVPLMDNPAAEKDHVAAVSLWVLKQEIDALRVKLEPLVREDLKIRSFDSAIKSLKNMDANCVVEYICTLGDEKSRTFFEIEEVLNSSNKVYRPRIRKVVIPFDINKIDNLSEFLKNIYSDSISETGSYGCLGIARLDLTIDLVYRLSDKDAYVSYKKVFQAIQTECKESRSYIEGKKDDRWTSIPDAKVFSGGYSQAYITQSYYKFGSAEYKWESNSLQRKALRDKSTNPGPFFNSFDPLYPHRPIIYPETPAMTRGRH